MMSIVARNVRVRPIAACLAAAFVLAPPLALATTRVVNTCADDDSVGSLRHQVSVAVSGDTIDLSTAQLACSLITLSGNEIATGLDSLTLQGPANRTVTITTSDSIRLLRHVGTATLKVSNLTLSGGYDDQNPNDARGGCIVSSGTVDLDHAVVTGCTAHSLYGRAQGGAVFATTVHLNHSVVSGNSAFSVHNNAYGGGIYTHDLGIHSYSTVTANAATSQFVDSYGGGAFAAHGAVDLYYSTVDANHARNGGGLYCAACSGFSMILHASTVSGNIADIAAGGIRTTNSDVNIQDSTIAFNSAQAIGGLLSAFSVRLNSSIVAKNRNTSPLASFADLYLSSGDLDSTGLDNLVQSYNVVPAAGVITITGDPQLAPLGFHGGPTRTHAPLATSPAVDHGNHQGLAATDQRGAGFDRVVNGTQDIGAYERQVNDDEIFYGGFD
jgi:hypothetical protein